MSTAGETMTLLLSVSAVERLEDPASAITDARGWTDHVGVVGNGETSVEGVETVVDDTGVEPDLVAGETTGGLAAIRQRFRTERHVFVGTTDEHRDVAAALGWEYLPVEDAAEKAEWSLEDRDAA